MTPRPKKNIDSISKSSTGAPSLHKKEMPAQMNGDLPEDEGTYDVLAAADETPFTKQSFAGTSANSAQRPTEPTSSGMHTSSLNLLPVQSRWKRMASRCREMLYIMTWKKWVLVFAGVAIAALLAFGVYAYSITRSGLIQTDSPVSFFKQVQNIVQPNQAPLKGEDGDRINVLLLGKGGGDHPGGELVDTIMVASVQPSTGKVALISLPRDLVVPHYPEGQKYPDYRKINNVVVLGGTEFATSTMKTVLGLDIHYVTEVDFSGFRNIVDTIDGVDIQVPNGFTGYYGANELSTPCPKAKLANLEDGAYCAITFAAGFEHMNGERALQYSRIRKMAPGSENPDEGTDFKRAARQQLILQAIKDKVFSVGTLANPVRITGLLKDLGDHISTNMEVWEMLRFAEMVQHVDQSKIKNVVIDQGEDGLVHRDTSVAAYVLVPNAGLSNYSELQSVALNVFDEQTVASEQTKKTLEAEQAVVIVQNGSSTEGLASRTATVLRTAGISVASFGNAAVKNATTTTVYDLSGNTKPATRAALEQQFSVTAVNTSTTKVNASVRVAGDVDASSIDLTELPASTDFVVVVGTDANNLKSINLNSSANTNNSAINTNTGTTSNASTSTNTAATTQKNSTNTNTTGSVRVIPVSGQ